MSVDSIVVSLFTLTIFGANPPPPPPLSQSSLTTDSPEESTLPSLIPPNSFIYIQAVLNNEILTTDPVRIQSTPFSQTIHFNTQLEFILTKRAYKYLKSVRSMIKLSCFVVSPHNVTTSSATTDDGTDMGRLLLGYYMIDLRSFTLKEKKSSIRLHSNVFDTLLDVGLSMISADYVHTTTSPVPLVPPIQSDPPLKVSPSDDITVEYVDESLKDTSGIISDRPLGEAVKFQTRITLKHLNLNRAFKAISYTLAFQSTNYSAEIVDAHEGVNHFPHSMFIIDSTEPLDEFDCVLKLDNEIVNCRVKKENSSFRFEGGELVYKFEQQALSDILQLPTIIHVDNPPEVTHETQNRDDKVSEEEKAEHEENIENVIEQGEKKDNVSETTESLPTDENVENDVIPEIKINPEVHQIEVNSPVKIESSSGSIVEMQQPIRETEEYKAAQLLQDWKDAEKQKFINDLQQKRLEIANQHVIESQDITQKFTAITVSKLSELSVLETRVSNLLNRLDNFRSKIKSDLDLLKDRYVSKSGDYYNLYSSSQDASRRMHDTFMDKLQRATEEYNRLTQKLDDVTEINKALRDQKKEFEISNSLLNVTKKNEESKATAERMELEKQLEMLQLEKQQVQNRLEKLSEEQKKYREIVKKSLAQVMALKRDINDKQKDHNERQEWKEGHILKELEQIQQ